MEDYPRCKGKKEHVREMPAYADVADVWWLILTMYAAWPWTPAQRVRGMPVHEERSSHKVLSQFASLLFLACLIVEIVTTISSPNSCMWVICASRDTSLRKYPACSVPNACFTAQVVYTCFLCAGLEYWNPTHTSRHHLLGQIRVRLRSEDTFVLILQVGLSFWSYTLGHFLWDGSLSS